MAGCEILDFRCIFVNELAGSITLAALLLATFYFIIASKARFGFDTTIAFAFPLLILVSLAVGGFSVVFAFATIIVAFMIAWIFERISGNK
jgi:hypothetical protein